MKNLIEISGSLQIEQLIGSNDLLINEIIFDSRKVEKGSLFVAQSGTNVDGHQFIDLAIQQGAVAVVCEQIPALINNSICYIQVQDSKKALGMLASEFYDHPSTKLKLIGITGTNGKTTIVTLLHNLFTQLGYKAGLLSTIENKIRQECLASTHTTPDTIQLNQLLDKMVKANVELCFMEVSSHAVDQERIHGLHFYGGVFTNLSHDHLDYHLTFDEYLKAKKKFFDQLSSSSFALSNTDDKRGLIMLQNTKAKKYTYGLRGVADFNTKIITNQFEGLELEIDKQPVWFKLIGKFNAYNLLAVYATAVLLGEDKLKVLTLMSDMQAAEGRFDQIRSGNNINVIIDYAHTPDALENVLKTIASIRTGNEQLITVIGTGGNRDKLKRPIMAQIACNNSDRVILTSDNPRDEDPDQIIDDMKAGLDAVQLRKALSITNRREAIKTALTFAKDGDIILVAGKGHEKYQIIKGEKLPFDEKEIVKQLLMNL
ncbi:MAG: UDP-N-acetylmuramoyl-L-alanyl-D-glutamate--2,6-diaminopimelate ligase [Bacteroidetes bacterium HGW-Bacteroidetes-17]|nr:MAG: UDP-N-acetylmuramoyl-L-alanyl-D-glutamate--2,6-diaminopimelate ligase [Bacteroidetes bacterium HGW-Bacteroidetes-17]